MKRLLCVLLTFSLLLYQTALAREISDISREEIEASVAKQYPDWHLWKFDLYWSGFWREEMANHCEVGLYRVVDKQLEIKELYALLNPLKDGDRIPWQASDWAKVPLTIDAAKRIADLFLFSACDYSAGFVFDDAIIDGCAGFLLEQGMTWEWLVAYPDFLVGIAVNAAGQQCLRIAHWDGAKYTRTTVSPMQQVRFDVNDIHSFNGFLEIQTKDIEFSLNCDSDDTWRLDSINTGTEIMFVQQQGIIDVTVGGNSQNNSLRYYGRPVFPLTVTELNVNNLPHSVEDALPLLDAQGYACTKADDAGLYDRPDGQLLANCYARLVGYVIEERGDWVRMTIGHVEYGMTGWFKRDNLAFGKEVNTVVCGFPSYSRLEDAYSNLLEPSISLYGYITDLWLIGQAPDGKWLVQVNQGPVFFAPKEAFTGIGPTEIW